MRPPSRLYADGNDGSDIAIEHRAVLGNRRGGRWRDLTRTLRMVALSSFPSPRLSVAIYAQQLLLARQGHAASVAPSGPYGRGHLGVLDTERPFVGDMRGTFDHQRQQDCRLVYA